MNRTDTAEGYIARILSFSEGREPWGVLESTPRRLRELTTGRSRAELSRAPDSRWSVVQVLAHLADVEVVTAWRLRSILATDGAPLQAFDQDVWADALRYSEIDAGDSIALFDANRCANLALLRRVDPARHAHHGMHAERGRESVEHLLRLYAGHDLNHLAQIDALLRS